MIRAKCQLPLLLFLFTACTAAGAFAQASIAGDWEMTITSPIGARTTAISLKQDGEKVTGSFKSQAGELPVEGTITGTDLKLAFTINFQGQPIPVTLTGIAGESSMSGKTDFGGLAEGDFTAKRPGTPAIDAPAPASAAEPAVPAPAAAGSAAGAAGSWDVTLKTPGGDVPITASLTDDAGKISGTVSSHLGELPVEGSIEGRTLKLSLVAKTPQGDIPVTLTGDIDGDAIVNGKANFGGMGQGEWTARRRP